MSYQEFLNEVCARIQGELGEAEISCLTVSAVNKNKRGIVIKNANRKAAPVIYFEDIYQDYRKNGNMNSCMEKAVKRIESYLALPAPDDILCGDLLIWEKVSQYLYLFLVSTDRNRQTLQMMMHRKFLDLSVCYMLRLPMKHREDFQGTVRVTCDIAAAWGRSEEELYQKAVENAGAEGYLIRKMDEVFTDILKKEYGENIPEEMDLLGMASSNLKLSVMSNPEFRYGAAGILDRKLLEGFARDCGADFYIIPSSIHEVLLLPNDRSAGPQELNDMVQMVNTQDLDEEDILSDHIYYYSRVEKKIRCC